jgi:hypothetical protein
LPGGADLIAYMNHANDNPYESVERIYWAVSTTAIRGVLDRIRTALTELVAELRHGMPDDAVLPPPDLVTQAIQVAVGGKNNRVVVTAAHSEGAALVGNVQEQEPESPGWSRGAKIGAAVVGLAGIIAAVFAVVQYLAT